MRRRGALVGLVAVSGVVALLWPRAEAPPEASLPSPSERPAAAKPQPGASPPVAGEGPASSPTISPARFEGEVVDSDQVPLAGAELDFEKDGKRTLVRADSRGRFSFEAEDGEWSIERVWAQGHLATKGRSTYFAAAGTVLSGLRFELEASRTIRGYVITSSGVPVEGAHLSIQKDYLDFAYGDSSLGRTDSAGRFEAEIGLQAMDLAVEHGCCFFLSEPIGQGVNSLEVTIRLREVSLPLHTLSGIVVDVAERPVAGATVTASSWARVDGGSVLDETTALSDEEGRFSLSLRGDAVEASAKHGARESAAVEWTEGIVVRLVLQPKDATIAGRVTDEGGQPVTKFTLQVNGTRGEGSSWNAVVTGDGRYRISGLTSGPKVVVVDTDGFAPPEERKVVLEPNTVLSGVDFVLVRGRNVTGTVIDDATGVPLSGARVSGSGSFTQSKENGFFELTAVALETTDLDTSLTGYVTRAVQLEAGEKGPVTIKLRKLDRGPRGELDYEGVGLGLDYDAELDGGNGYPVIRLHPEGGARVAGIHVGDEILRAEGIQAGSLPFVQFNGIIKGRAGTVVRLTIRRDGRTFDVSVGRRKLTW